MKSEFSRQSQRLKRPPTRIPIANCTADDDYPEEHESREPTNTISSFTSLVIVCGIETI